MKNHQNPSVSVGQSVGCYVGYGIIALNKLTTYTWKQRLDFSLNKSSG